MNEGRNKYRQQGTIVEHMMIGLLAFDGWV